MNYGIPEPPFASLTGMFPLRFNEVMLIGISSDLGENQRIAKRKINDSTS